MIKRRETRSLNIGSVGVGSGHPVSIQSMVKVPTSDVARASDQIRDLEAAGCEIVRLAVKSPEDARALADIKKETSIPLVADIHFDHRLALEAIESGVDKIRVNPGNIRKAEDIERVIKAAGQRGMPIRLGVNSGSLAEMASGKGSPAEAMVDGLLQYIEHFTKMDFNDIVISLKSSDVVTTVEAYRLMALKCDYPFHLGVTAAGSYEQGVVKSCVGIGGLLLDGIGDTVRVSLTGDPVDEVLTARNILSSVGLRKFGHEMIACPTCGRCQVDLVPIVKELEEELKNAVGEDASSPEKQLLIAVMGCEVNGPGEAMAADIGIAFGKGKGAIFRKGVIVKTVKESEAIKELLNMIREELK